MRLLAALVVLCVGLGACSAPLTATATPRPPVTPAPLATKAPVSACAQAFAAAAAVGPDDDSVSDLFPAVRACSLAEWRAEFARYVGLGFTGSAESVLDNMCTGAAEITSTALCSELTSSQPTAANGIDAASICAGTDWPGCVDGVQYLESGWLIAVCQYSNHQGDIVLLDTKSEAESMCSANGIFPDSRVVRVLQLP